MTRSTIRPGEVLLDDRGRIAQLHGIGMLRIDGRFWAWGESKENGAFFTAVACYSSDDLVSWRFEGDALRPGGGLDAETIVERPKVLRRPDGRYAMLLHVDRIGDGRYVRAEVGYAVADRPEGPYAYLGSSRPLGHESRDIGVYQDESGSYLLSEDRPNGLAIYRLSDGIDAVTELVARLVRPEGSAHPGYESPTLVRHDGLYYLFGSDLTGWDLNDNVYATAASLEGPWSPWRAFAPLGTSTWDSQVSIVVPIEGDDGVTRHLYAGDRWRREDLWSSGAVWLPIDIGGGAASLAWREEWDPSEILGRGTAS